MLNADLTVVKDLKYDNHDIFLRVIKLENYGFNIVIRHLKPLLESEEPTFEVMGKPKDLGFIGFEYLSALKHINEKDFTLKLDTGCYKLVTEGNISEYLEEQLKMIAFTQETIANVRKYLRGSELEHYIS